MKIVVPLTKISLRVITVIFIWLYCCLPLWSQSVKDDSRIQNYQSYFSKNREKVFLHLNKEVFLPTDVIYFTGYLWASKPSRPSEVSTNLRVGIYTEGGVLLDAKIFPSINGVVSGQLDANLPQGRYFIKASTSYIDQMEEYSPFVIPITIINDIIQEETFDAENYGIVARCEGGECLINLDNAIAVDIQQYSASSKKVGKVFISNERGDEVSVLREHTSNLFYGTFTPRQLDDYELRIRFEDGFLISQPIAVSAEPSLGIQLNPLLQEKIIIRLLTNSNEKLKGEYTFIFHNNDQMLSAAVDLTKEVQAFTFSKEELWPGVNTLVVLDKDGRSISERLFYNEAEVAVSEVDIAIEAKYIKADSVSLTFDSKWGLPPRKVSVSVLAEESEAYENLPIDTYGLFSGYLTIPVLKRLGSVRNTNRPWLQQVKLLQLLYGQPILPFVEIEKGLSSEKSLLKAERGFDIAGSVKFSRVARDASLFWYQKSSANVQNIPIDAKGNFISENNYVLAGEKIIGSVQSAGEIINKPEIDLGVYPVLGLDSISSQLLSPFKKVSPSNLAFEMEEPAALTTNDILSLEEVALTARTKKIELKRNTRLQSGIWEGVKIDADLVKKRPKLSQFIRSLGFRVVVISANEFQVVGKVPLDPPPDIFVDDFQQFGPLTDDFLQSIDEVYFENMGVTRSPSGTIYIYRKYGATVGNDFEGAVQLDVDSGYTEAVPYVNSTLALQFDARLKKYGALYWKNSLMENGTGSARIAFKSFGLKNFRVLIQGIDSVGVPFFITRIVSLE